MKDSNPDKDHEYLMSLGPEEIEEYRGEWVAIASQEIVAHGKDPKRVHTEAWKAGKGIPLMEYIYADASEADYWHNVPYP